MEGLLTTNINTLFSTAPVVALSKDFYRDICKYFGIWSMEEQISARQGKFMSSYYVSESDVCRAIGRPNLKVG